MTTKKVSSQRIPRSPQRTPAGNRTTARGRFPGFRVVAFAHLPKASASVACRTIAHRLQLRGQPRYLTAFPFKSPGGEPCAYQSARSIAKSKIPVTDFLRRFWGAYLGEAGCAAPVYRAVSCRRVAPTRASSAPISVTARSRCKALAAGAAFSRSKDSSRSGAAWTAGRQRNLIARVRELSQKHASVGLIVIDHQDAAPGVGQWRPEALRRRRVRHRAARHTSAWRLCGGRENPPCVRGDSRRTSGGSIRRDSKLRSSDHRGNTGRQRRRERDTSPRRKGTVREQGRRPKPRDLPKQPQNSLSPRPGVLLHSDTGSGGNLVDLLLVGLECGERSSREGFRLRIPAGSSLFPEQRHRLPMSRHLVLDI